MEEEFLNQVLAGNTHEFKYFVKKYKEMVFAIAFRILKNKEDAEEIAQDAFLKAFQKLNQFDRKAKFSTWLYKIVFRLALNKKRKFSFQVADFKEINELELMDDTSQSLQKLALDDQKKYIQLAINELNEDESLALTLFYLAENTIEEICEITNWTISNTKIKLHRGRKSLYFALNNQLKHEINSIY